MEQILHIHLLGEFRLQAGDEPITGLAGERQQSLLAYLLLHRHAPQPRHHLAFLLWPDSSEAQARANLRNLLYTLRHALPEPDRFLLADTLTLQWRPDAPFTLDVAEFQHAVVQARQARDPVHARPWLERAVDIYAGDLLPGNYEDAMVAAREDLRQEYLAALDRLVQLLEDSGEYPPAMRLLQRRLRQDPLHEPVYVQWMRLHALSGDRAGVRRIYQQCVATLEQELGVEPSPTTQAAYQQLLRLPAPAPVAVPSPAVAAAQTAEAHWSPHEQATPRPSPRRSTELSAPLASLVGRTRELAELAELLANPDCRLLTIAGPGGMGKTHLALQTAKAHQPVFPDGVFFISLAPVPSVDLLLPTIAGALGFVFAVPVEPEQQLLEYLREKRLLLVLDNLEHLLDGVDLLISCLAHAPGLKILVTSRERLHLQHEWVYDLDGLPVPAEDQAGWQENAAVRLFAETARRADARFELSEANRGAIIRICRLVEGMPLALILAAAWVYVLPPREIAGEIERNLDFLASTHRNMPERHRSLRAVFDHSWTLLSAAEQQALRRLSPLQGGFTREAAATIANADLRLLSSLVDKSWLRYRQAGRYDVHDQVRQYTADHLQHDAEEAESAHDSHSRYFLSWLAEQDPVIHGADPGPVVAAIMADINNVRAAWSRALSHGRYAELEATMNTLFEFFAITNRFRQGDTLFLQAIDALLPESRAPGFGVDGRRLLGHARALHGYMLIRQGRLEQAGEPIQSSLALLTPLGPGVALANALYIQGLWAHFRNDYARAESSLRDCIALNQQLGDAASAATAYLVLGQNAYLAGDYAAAYQETATALHMARAAQDTWMTARIRCWLGLTALTLGQWDEAEQHALACLESARRSGDHWIGGQSLIYLGLVAHLRGEQAHAHRQVEEGIAVWKTIDQITGRLHQVNIVAAVTARLGADAIAWRLYQEAFHMALAVHYPPFALDALLGLAELSARAGEVQRSAAWLAAAERHPDLRPASRTRLAALRAGLNGRLAPLQQVPALAAIQDEIRKLAVSSGE